MNKANSGQEWLPWTLESQGEQRVPAPHIPAPLCGELQFIFFIMILLQLRNAPILGVAALVGSSGVERPVGTSSVNGSAL